jgi:hypothetical protein
MLKICGNCLEIYDDFEPNVYCPKKSCQCDCKLIKIDDLLIDVIRKYWSLDLYTYCCCSGHLYDNYFSPYVTFFSFQFEEEDLRVDSEVSLSLFKEAHRIFIGLQKEGIRVYEIFKNDEGYGFNVRADIDPINEQLSSQEKLKVQLNFLNFLYKAADEFEKASCGKRKKSTRKEEHMLLQI